jgi:hypothetical protein
MLPTEKSWQKQKNKLFVIFHIYSL